jgi:hypothetical protein
LAPALDAVVIHPQPQRIDRRRDLEWFSGTTRMIAIDEGLFDPVGDQLVAGML